MAVWAIALNYLKTPYMSMPYSARLAMLSGEGFKFGYLLQFVQEGPAKVTGSTPHKKSGAHYRKPLNS